MAGKVSEKFIESLRQELIGILSNRDGISEEKEPARDEKRILVAVSGGADSLALLLSLQEVAEEMGLIISALHVEHGIRGEESMSDAAFVEDLCDKEKIPLRVVHVDAKGLADEEKLSIEEAARILRYQALKEAAREEGAMIAVAHHMEDQVETILLHLLRGSGGEGLAGMRTFDRQDGIAIIRPLLHMSRKEIESYLALRGQEYCTDSTNQDDRNPRNRIRHDILPVFEQMKPDYGQRFGDAADLLQEERDYIKGEAGILLRKCQEIEKSSDVLHRKKLLELTDSSYMRREVLRLWLQEELPDGCHDIMGSHLRAAEDLLLQESGKETHLPGAYRLMTNGDFLYLLAEGEKIPGKGPEISMGRLYISEEEWEEGRQIPESVYTKYVDCDKIENTLVLRARQPGDRIWVRKDKSKAFKDWCIDEKIPRELRDQIPLVCDGNRVIWAVGYRLGENAKVTDETRRIFTMNWRSNHE